MEQDDKKESVDNPKVIKTITPTICPHTGQPAFVCFTQLPPTLTWLLTQKQIDEAKTMLLLRVKELMPTKEQLANVQEWLQTDEAIFGPDEIDAIIDSIKDDIKINK